MVVSCHNNRRPHAINAIEKANDSERRPWIEVPRGLVGEEDQGTIHECTGDGDPLLFAAGQLVWEAVELFPKPNQSACLRHCRSPLMQFLQYASWKGRARDLRVGLHHGAYCVGCCWGLMVVLLVVGLMNVAAMVGLTAVIFLEKLWRHGKLLSILVGLALLAMAALVAIHPSILAALQPGNMSGAMGN